MSDAAERTASPMRSSWVGALSAGQESNWGICKDKGLWGSGAASSRGVRAGDDFFVWQSGGGWFARCRVTSDARRPTLSDPAPWDDGRDYKWIFGIEVIKENAELFNPGSTNNVQHLTEIQNIRLGQFPKLSIQQAKAVLTFFGLVNPPSDATDEAIDMENNAHELELTRRGLRGVEVETLIKARRGQGLFRSRVLQIEKSCRVTGLGNPHHLVASHIKPWRNSNDHEKVDGCNGLMLSPHVDHLFDRGWIRFEHDGRLELSPLLDENVLRSWRIEPDPAPKRFLAKQIEYLEYHRELIFQH